MQLTVNTKVYNNMIYSEQQTATFDRQHFAYLKIQEENHILSIQLNRPLQKNALNEILQRELAFALSYAHFNKDIRVINLSAAGDIFCAGADLKTLMGHRDKILVRPYPKNLKKLFWVHCGKAYTSLALPKSRVPYTLVVFYYWEDALMYWLVSPAVLHCLK
jgi:hypothetical protein